MSVSGANGRTPSAAAPSPELTLAVPPALVDAIAHRVAELVAENLPTSPAEPYLTVDQAAAYLGCKAHRIYDLVSMRRVRHFRDGRRVLFRREDLDAALEIEEAR